jgi:hypothetical protein
MYGMWYSEWISKNSKDHFDGRSEYDRVLRLATSSEL